MASKPPSQVPSSSPHPLRQQLSQLREEQQRQSLMLSRLLEESEPDTQSPPVEPVASPPVAPQSDPPNHRAPEFLEPREAPTPPQQEEELLRIQQEEADRVQLEADRLEGESVQKKKLAGLWL